MGRFLGTPAVPGIALSKTKGWKMKLTINQLIEKLEALKLEPGLSGDTPVTKKNGGYWVYDVRNIKTERISATAFKRNKDAYDIVASRGVKVVVIC